MTADYDRYLAREPDYCDEHGRLLPCPECRADLVDEQMELEEERGWK